MSASDKRTRIHLPAATLVRDGMVIATSDRQSECGCSLRLPTRLGATACRHCADVRSHKIAARP